MTYYDTIEEDLTRAKEILAKDTIYGEDTFASYKLLESFVAEIQRLRIMVAALAASMNDETLYKVAKQTCHELGMPWTDPRTGQTYPPPQR